MRKVLRLLKLSHIYSDFDTKSYTLTTTIILIIIIIIIIVVISITPYLTNKGEDTALYKINSSVNMKPQK